VVDRRRYFGAHGADLFPCGVVAGCRSRASGHFDGSVHRDRQRHSACRPQSVRRQRGHRTAGNVGDPRLVSVLHIGYRGADHRADVPDAGTLAAKYADHLTLLIASRQASGGWCQTNEDPT
jgi:hypothetical protein